MDPIVIEYVEGCKKALNKVPKEFWEDVMTYSRSFNSWRYRAIYNPANGSYYNGGVRNLTTPPTITNTYPEYSQFYDIFIQFLHKINENIYSGSSYQRRQEFDVAIGKLWNYKRMQAMKKAGKWVKKEKKKVDEKAEYEKEKERILLKLKQHYAETFEFIVKIQNDALGKKEISTYSNKSKDCVSAYNFTEYKKYLKN